MTRSVDGRSIEEALKKPSIPGFRARGRARPRWWCPRTSGDTSLCDQLLHLEPLAYGRRVAQTTLPLTDTCPVCALQALARSLSDCDRLLADRRDGPKASPWAAAVASIAGARDVLKRRGRACSVRGRGSRTGRTLGPCAPVTRDRRQRQEIRPLGPDRYGGTASGQGVDLTPASLVPDFARHARAALELPPDDADGSCKPL